MDVLTTTIRRGPFADIVAGIKPIEYREMKKYWKDKLAKYETPFLLRLINGMSKKAPELTVIVKKVKPNKKTNRFELYLGQIKAVKNWNVKKNIVETWRGGDFRVDTYTKENRLFHKKTLIYKLKRTSNEKSDAAKINRKIDAFEKHLAKTYR